MLAEASVLLASSLDYETTLESLTRLSTAEFSDWCAVDLVNDDGTIRHLTVTHANPVMRELALQFQEVAFSEPDIAPGAPEALRRRSSVLLLRHRRIEAHRSATGRKDHATHRRTRCQIADQRPADRPRKHPGHDDILLVAATVRALSICSSRKN